MTVPKSLGYVCRVEWCRNDAETHIVLAWHLRGCELGVVRAATGRVDPAPGDALLKDRIVDVEVQHLVDLRALLLKSSIQLQKGTHHHVSACHSTSMHTKKYS
jgi:hypothetical protein